MAASDILWTEKYRPKAVGELVLPPRVMQKLQDGPRHLLLHGGPGCGKTSAAKALAAGSPSMFINCSLHTGVDEVRSVITDFCSTASVVDGEGSMKVVVLDEFDGVSEQYFKALRGTIEEFHATTRFVATTNHLNKVPEAVQSRFECVSFDFDAAESADLELAYVKRVYAILEAEGMPAERRALLTLVRRTFPDMRSVIVACQGMKRDGALAIGAEDVGRYRGAHSELFDVVLGKSDPVANYQLVAGYAGHVDDAIRSLGRDFADHLAATRPDLCKHLGHIVYEVNRHSVDSRTALDPLVTLLSLVFRLQTVLHQ